MGNVGTRFWLQHLGFRRTGEQFIMIYFIVKLLLSPGSLVVERGPGRPPITNHQAGPRPEANTGGLSASALTAAQQRQSTLAQLQMQVGFVSQSVSLVP